MKILYVIDDLKLGGSQNLALRTLKRLSDVGVEANLCVLGQECRAFAWEWLPANTTFFELPTDYRKPGQVRALIHRLLDEVNRCQPELLHSWMWTSDYITARCNSRYRLPHMSHIVDRRVWQESSQWKHRYRRWLTRRAFRKAGTRFFAVSHAAKDFAVQTLQLDPLAITVAWNSVEPNDFAETPPVELISNPTRQLQLGMASRLEPEKGHLVMLDALALLRENGKNVALKMTGQGPYQKILEDRISDLKLEGCTEFVGFVESVQAFLAGIDVFVVPSIDSEGLPTTILESMAAGRPVIATDIGGATEAIRDRIEGRIIPANDPESLRVAITELADDRGSMGEMIVAAKKRVEESFSMDTMMQVITQQYAAQLLCRPL